LIHQLLTGQPLICQLIYTLVQHESSTKSKFNVVINFRWFNFISYWIRIRHDSSVT